MKMKTLVGAVLVAVSLGFAPVLSAATYWRWTSNATADESTWTKSENPVLSVPAFTGATVEDNVLELLDDCSVAEILYFIKSCTICSKADLASAATVTRLFYTLETATEPQGEWAPAKGPQAETGFSVQVDGDRRFYRIKVSD